MKKSIYSLTGLIFMVFSSLAWADTSWTGVAADNDFNNPGNWTAGVPNSTTNANLTGASGDLLTIGSNASTAATTANLSTGLILSTSSGVTLSIGGNATLTGNGPLAIGGAGTVTFSGSANQFGSLYVIGGTGNQLAGASSISEFAVGTGAANVGSFILSGGSITVNVPSTNSPTPSFRVGDFGGTGTFTQEAGTTVTIGSNTQAASLTIGNQGGNGAYNLTGGTLTVANGYINLGRSTNIAYGPGSGQLNISGGLLEIQSGAYLALGGNSSPTPQGTGILTQTDGTLRIDAGGTLYLSAYGTGTYNLDGGMLQVGGNGLQSRFAAGAPTTHFNLGGGTIQVYGSALTTTAAVNLVANTSSTLDTNSLGATFSGIVSGSGGLTKTGLGTAILSGANTYSGGTIVNQGLLQAGNATAFGTGSLGVGAAGTANLNGFSLALDALNGSTGGLVTNGGATASQLSIGNLNGSGSYAGAIANGTQNISFVKNGTGTQILSGNNTYSGGTTLAAGGLLAGSATAFGTGNVIINGGTLGTDGINHSIQVGDNTHVSNYSQNAGTLFLAGASPATFDHVTITGAAALGGNLTVDVLDGFAPSGPVDLLHADGGVTDNGQTVTLILPSYLQAQVAYSADDVELTFNQLFLGRTPGLTSNQYAVANYIDSIAPTGKITALADNIYPLIGNPNAEGAALNQISPQSLQVFRSIAFDNATFNGQLVNDHLANLRDGLTGFDGSQFTINDPALDPTLSQINSHLLAWNPDTTSDLVSDSVAPIFAGLNTPDSKDVKSVQAREPADQWSTFIAGNVVLADLSQNENLENQNYTTGSVMAGADYRIDKHFTVGALFAYGHTSASLDYNGSSATVDSYSPGIYASYVNGGWYGNGLFSYSHNNYTEDRNISIGALNGTNHGAPDGNQFTGSLTGGYEFQRGQWKFGPLASLQYVNLGINSFNEQGPTALAIQDQKAESLRSQFGIEVRYLAQVGSVTLTPHLSASWQHEFLDNSDGITSQFNQVGSGSFTVQTTNPERDSAFIDVGLDAKLAKELTIFADYQTEAGQENFFAQSIQAGVKIGF